MRRGLPQMHMSCTAWAVKFDLSSQCLMVRHLRFVCTLYESVTLLRPWFIRLRVRSTSLPTFPP